MSISEIVNKYNMEKDPQKIKDWHAKKIFSLCDLKKQIVRQKPVYVHFQIYRNEIYVYLRKYTMLLAKSFDFVYIDESSINRKTYKRLKL